MRAEHWIYTIPLRLRSLFRRNVVEHDLDDELQYHVEQLTAQHIARGLDGDAARTQALRAIGGLERRKEEIRAARRVSAVEDIGRDLRYALRTLRRTPAFSVIAVLTLALGIGANTAIFTVVNGVLLRPLPYADPGRIIVLPGRGATVAPATFLDWQAASRSFERMGMAEYWSPSLTGSNRPEQVTALHVSAGLFPLLGVAPLIGRTFTSDEEHDGRNHVVVLRYDIWRDRFGSDPKVVGRTVTLDGEVYTVIGVMPKGFIFAPFWSTAAQIWAPLVLDARRTDRNGASLRGFGRLRPGVTLAAARSEMSDIAARMERQYPGTNLHVTMYPLQEVVVGDVRAALLILLAATGLVLLIACANVTHLQLLRAASRERESAMRLSLGASRRRLLQQSLVESLVVSFAGGAAGLVLAMAGVRALVAMAPADIPRVESIAIDPRVFLFMLLLAVGAGLVSGLVPALGVTRVDPNQVLKESGRAAGNSRRRQRAGRLLVISEFAMAVILLVGAGLVLRSFAAMIRAEPGFDRRNVITTVLSTRGTSHEPLPARNAFFDGVIARTKALPQVTSVSAINHVPLHGDNWHFSYYIAGQPKSQPDQTRRALFRVVRAGYFETMRIPLVRGREIEPADMTGRAHVVVIDETMARAGWPGKDPIGEQISVDDPVKGADWFTVIGVVKDVREANWSGTHTGEMYYPYWTGAGTEPARGLASMLHPTWMSLIVRTSGNPAAIVPALRRIVSDLDPDVPVADIITMDQALAEQVAGPGFYLALLAGFAVTALVLAMVGVYGVISYVVSTRTREIGIRLALGARQNDSFMLVVRQGLVLAVTGAALGVVGALVLTTYLQSLLYHVRANDPVTFVITPLVLVLVAVIACYLPARRAARIDPIIAIRSE